MSAITERTARAVEDALKAKHGLIVVRKSDAGPWSWVASLFTMLRTFGVNVPEGKEMIEKYATTVLMVVSLPKNDLDPEQLVLLLAHEAVHGVQWYADPARMPILYLQHTEKRAAYEAEAVAHALAVAWAMTNTLPARVEDLPSTLAYGYALTPGDIGFIEKLVEQEATAIAGGVIPPGPARTVIATLAKAQPDAIHPRSLELMRKHWPELGASGAGGGI